MSSHPRAPGAADSAVQAASPAGKGSIAGTDASIAPEPQRLLLIATSPGRNRHEGTARLGTDPDNPQTYVAGAILSNGARIAEIHADHVVLNRGNQKLTLYIASGKDRGMAASRSTGAEPLALVGGSNQPPAPAAERPQARLTDFVRSMPVYHNDVLAGLEVQPGQNAGAFAQLGLRPGDVIIAVEGIPIADVASASAALAELTNGVAITVTVERGNETASLALDGAIIAKTLEQRSPMAAAPPPAPM